MVDNTRRNTLKAFSGVVAIAAPAIAAGTANGFPNDTNRSTAMIDVVSNTTQAELSVALNVDNESTIRLTNNSQRPLEVNHIYPGFIHTGAHTYDVNSVLAGNAVTLRAGESRIIPIQPNARLQAETAFPRVRYRNQPQRIVSVTGKNRLGELVSSTRSFYS